MRSSPVAPFSTSQLVSAASLARFSPEPQSRFSKFLTEAFSMAKGAAWGVPSVAPEFQTLIELQMYWQYQMQMVSMVSNIEKSRHETAMAAVRNVRVG